MSENFRRVELSPGDADPISTPRPRGINKGRIILYITAGAAALSVASTILGYYKWQQGEEALAKATALKADAETAKLQFDRTVSSIDAKYADALKRFELNLMQKDTELRVQQLRTELTAQEKNRREAELASAKTRVEIVNGEVADDIVKPLVPLLQESTRCTTTRFKDPSCSIAWPLVSPQSLAPYPVDPHSKQSDLPIDPYAHPLAREPFLPLRR